MRYNPLLAMAVASLGLSSAVAHSGTDLMSDDEGTPRKPLPKKKARATSKPRYTPHPAMPEGGWPETRQQRRARLRAGKKEI